ncbi:hypothetical protein [Streptosporangium roseum]|uniref:Uncharacterized protein n=1 Tax=Streptosporangium roseum (strain ATCC 12428 / DSM 43021 / JCM 3005 / KCTC 9067 / NCIMB 10171 / NRRL 2505 / NI 9100) TaxID=479432 RepID=D2BFY5_STRRD|nr:hypothetical protein [Streptosporangium roseum]ACZ92037.1 hypothetical protein Sros_9421 [Streptosporangium roseum DSM 43021]
MNITKHLNRPFAAALIVAATAVVSLDTPPEPITDGSYRDGSYTEEEDQQDEEPKKKTRKNKADDDQDDAGSC